MRQRQPEPEPEPNPAAKAIAEAEARWRRKERLRSLGLFLGKMFHLLVRLIVLAALVAGGWYLWNKFKSGDEDTVLSGPDNGETVLSKNRPSGSASSSPTQTVANAALEEARKQRDKRLAELQRLKDERQISQSRKMAYEALLRKFREARMDYWKNAPAEDRPGKVKEPLTFNCLVPETNSFAILALSCKPDEPMSVQRISPTDDPVELSSDDFKRITADAPYLVMRDERSYFCTPGKLSVITNSVPSSGQLANPSKDTFGALYDLILKLHIKRPDFQWQVSFLPRGFETSIDICSVKFGEMVSRGRFYPKVREAMRIYEENQIRRRAARNTRKAKRPARTVVLYDGDTIRKDIKGVTQVPRTFNYIGSNRHKYSINSYNYNSERRKEEQAREKWTKLYNEAVRQENAERDANRAVETAVSNVEITSQEVEDVLNVGKMIYKAVERD